MPQVDLETLVSACACIICDRKIACETLSATANTTNHPSRRSRHHQTHPMLSKYHQISHKNPFGFPKTLSSTGSAPTVTTGNSNSANLEEASKHAIMHRTGLPARDLWILDPLLSYPSIDLGRERAIVIDLEHIKAIITTQEVLLLNSRDPSVTSFVEELRMKCGISCFVGEEEMK